MARNRDVGLKVAKDLNAAIRRLNTRTRRAKEKGVPFVVCTRCWDEAGSKVTYLDVLATMPSPPLSPVADAERCEA